MSFAGILEYNEKIKSWVWIPVPFKYGDDIL